jgi:hypothetical protein
MWWLSSRLNSPESCLGDIEWKNTFADNPNKNNKKGALSPGFLLTSALVAKFNRDVVP